MSHGFKTASGAAHQSRHEQRQAETERMLRGPHLLEDGYTLAVPSDWYHEDAVPFWKEFSFQFNFDGESKTWQRDTRRPVDGKTYTPLAWLESTRAKYLEFWSTREFGRILEKEGAKTQ